MRMRVCVYIVSVCVRACRYVCVCVGVCVCVYECLCVCEWLCVYIATFHVNFYL